MKYNKNKKKKKKKINNYYNKYKPNKVLRIQLFIKMKKHNFHLFIKLQL